MIENPLGPWSLVQIGFWTKKRWQKYSHPVVIKDLRIENLHQLNYLSLFAPFLSLENFIINNNQIVTWIKHVTWDAMFVMSIDIFEASFHSWHWWALAKVPVFLRRWSEVYTKIVWLDFPLIIAMYRGNPGYVTPCYWRSISQKSGSLLTSDQYDGWKLTTVKRGIF